MSTRRRGNKQAKKPKSMRPAAPPVMPPDEFTIPSGEAAAMPTKG